MDEDNNGDNWPLSNNPIFIALILLVATAVTLAMGDEKLAEDLAIYAYYFLVLGVGIRFLEFREFLLSSVTIPFFQKHGPHCCEGSIGAGVLYLWCVKCLAQLRRWICGSDTGNNELTANSKRIKL